MPAKHFKKLALANKSSDSRIKKTPGETSYDYLG